MMKCAFTGFEAGRMARAAVRDVAVSFKSSVMVARALRGLPSDKALLFLQRVMRKEAAVPFTRFTNGAGHRRGIGPGKYPVKAAASFLELLKQGVANAENKGLSGPFRIVHVLANEGGRPLHPGSRRSRLMKRTHLELVLAEEGAGICGVLVPGGADDRTPSPPGYV